MMMSLEVGQLNDIYEILDQHICSLTNMISSKSTSPLGREGGGEGKEEDSTFVMDVNASYAMKRK